MTLTIQNPATEEIIRELTEDTPETVRNKAQRARAARSDWARTPLAARIEMLKAFRGAIERDKERLAAITTSEVGKPIAQARNELAGLLGRIDFFTENTAATIQPETVFSDATITERIEHEPLGVVANISAWNYPYFVGANVFVPALLTGNTVLYKPSEFATLTGLAIAELLHAAGVPEDVFVPVIGGGAVGAALLEQPLDGVFFTGSSSAAKTPRTWPTTSTSPRPRPPLPMAPSTTPGRAAVPSSASTSTSASTMHSWRRSRPR
jgi:acyl-CoA reductase-like NAD-dependent aldehyde dehydrogenase